MRSRAEGNGLCAVPLAVGRDNVPSRFASCDAGRSASAAAAFFLVTRLRLVTHLLARLCRASAKIARRRLGFSRRPGEA